MQVNNNNGFVNISSAQKKSETALEKMSKGVNDKINDAALKSVATILNSQASALTQGVANANDNVAILQIADGVLSSVSDDAQRLNELSVKSSNAALNSEQRSALNSEFSKLTQNINNSLSKSSYNSQSLFSRSFETSLGDGSSITTTITSPNTQALNINSQESIKSFMNEVNSIRGELGSSTNALQSSVSAQLQNIINTTEAASNMIDTDYAKEASNVQKSELQMNVATITQAHKSELLQNKFQALLA